MKHSRTLLTMVATLGATALTTHVLSPPVSAGLTEDLTGAEFGSVVLLYGPDGTVAGYGANFALRQPRSRQRPVMMLTEHLASAGPFTLRRVPALVFSWPFGQAESHAWQDWQAQPERWAEGFAEPRRSPGTLLYGDGPEPIGMGFGVPGRELRQLPARAARQIFAL